MKVLVILVYFDRPNMVQNAIDSLRRQTCSDWELAVIDDGSDAPCRPVVENMLPSDARVKYYRCNDTVEDKHRQGGSRHGSFVNRAIFESDADVVVVLCDDDALVEDYVAKLIVYYEANPSTMWSYCHVVAFNPETSPVPWGSKDTSHWLNRVTEPVAPSCVVDSSQVSFRRACINTEVCYPSPATVNLDAALFLRFAARHGTCPWNGLIGQYKAVFQDQMGTRANRYKPRDIPSWPVIR